MSKYNKTKEVQAPVTNLEGGLGYKLNPEFELISLLSSGLDSNFYEQESDKETRLKNLIETLAVKNPEFVAKALIYARTVMGQRSITHVGAVMLVKFLSGTTIGSKFFSKRNKKENKGGIIFRTDDMSEILSYYFLRNETKTIPNSIKKGFKSAIENCDTYELAKYQAKNKNISLVDIVNLVHPRPEEKMVETFKKLMTGELKQFNTAEDKNTKSGQVVAEKVKTGELSKEQAETELNNAKAENWSELITSGKLGYFALLRNLRNIATQSTDDVFKMALDLLVNEKLVRESLVFPHQIDIAFEVIYNDSKIDSLRLKYLLEGIGKAYEMSIPNLSNLFTNGKTAVVFDTSGSMNSTWAPVYVNNSSYNRKPVEKAALIAATLAKGIKSDMFHFGSRCEEIKFNPLDSISTIKNTGLSLIGKVGHGTDFDSIFAELSKHGKYDRIFIISDMQGADSINKSFSYKFYREKYGMPYIYSINLCGHETTMFKQSNKIINLFGYSKDIYEYVKVAEIDPNKILKEINAIEI